MRPRFRALTHKAINFASQQLIDAVSEMQEDYAEQVIRRVRPYPPEKPGSTYQRTKALESAWDYKQRQTREGLVLTIFNEVSKSELNKEEGDRKNYQRWVVYDEVSEEDQGRQDNIADGWRHIDSEDILNRPLYRRKLQEVMDKFARKGV